VSYIDLIDYKTIFRLFFYIAQKIFLNFNGCGHMRHVQQAFIAISLFLSHSPSYLIGTDQTIFSSYLDIQLQHLEEKQEDKKRLDQLFDLYWNWSIEDNPEEASYIGYPGSDGRWSDLSEHAFTQRQRFLSQFLDILNSIDKTKLDVDDKISAEILSRTLIESIVDI